MRNSYRRMDLFSNHSVMLDHDQLPYAREFIMELSSWHDTLVRDQGVTLSGGEKQRIVIARAMIRRPEFLILDEATSALDNISEAAVQKAIDQVAKECTTLVIAHRLTTIRNADKIAVIEKGRIVEEGEHGELLEKKGKYWEMSTTRDESYVEIWTSKINNW